MDVKPVLFAFVLLCASGCGTLFNADFESDPEGRLPLERPPGFPDGDRVFIPVREPETEDEGAVATVIRDIIGGPLEGAKVRYANRPLDPEVKWMAFAGIEPSASRDAYWYTWRGMLLGESPLEIKFQVGGATGAFGTIAVLRMSERFGAGRLQLMTDGQYQTVAVLPEPFEVHTGILKFDKRAREYSVTIYHGHTFISTELPLPIRIEPRPSLLPPTLSIDDRAPYMILLFPVEGIGSSYYIDDVRITERCPGRITRPLPPTEPYGCG